MTGVVAHISKIASKLNTINFPKCVLILLFLNGSKKATNNIKKNIKNIMSLSTKLVR